MAVRFRTSRVWTKDRKPLGEWAVDWRFQHDLGISQEEIDNMDCEKRIFYLGLFEEIDRQEKKAMDKMRKKSKRMRRK